MAAPVDGHSATTATSSGRPRLCDRQGGFYLRTKDVPGAGGSADFAIPGRSTREARTENIFGSSLGLFFLFHPSTQELGRIDSHSRLSPNYVKQLRIGENP